MIRKSDPLQQALSTKRSYSFYQIPASQSNFFKTHKYDFEYFGLTFMQRIVGFIICFFIGCLFMFYSFTRIPMAFLYPMAFAAPYAISNIMFFVMFGFLSGFRSYCYNLFEENKRIYSIFFLTSTICTLYSAMFNMFKYFKFILMIIQFASFVCFSITFIPGGAAGITSLVGVVLKK